MFKNFFRGHKIEIVVFLIALVARFLALFSAVFYQGEGVLHLSDSGNYIGLAESIVGGHGFSDGNGLPHFLYLPGYSFFLAVSFFLFGGLWPALITQIFLSSLVPVMILRIGRILEFFPKINLAGALLSALEPHLVIFSIVYMTEALYGFLFMASILFFARLVKSGLTANAFSLSIVFGLAAYVKVSNYLILIFLISAVFYLRLIKADVKKIFAVYIIIFSVFIAVVFPWFLRNFLHSGLWRMSSHEAYNLYVYDGASILSLRDGITYEEGKTARVDSWRQETGGDVAAVRNNLELSEKMHKQGKEFVIKNLGSALKLFFLTFISFWTSHNYAYFFTYFFAVLEKPAYIIPPTQLLFQGNFTETFYGTVRFISSPYYIVSLAGKFASLVIAVFSFWGIGALYSSGGSFQRSFAVFTALLFIYFSLVSFGAGFGIEGRIRYPVEPLIILFAVFGIKEFLAKFLPKLANYL